MRMMDYPKTKEIVKGSTYLNVDSAGGGTKAIESDDLRKQLMSFVSSEEYYDLLDRIGIPVSYRANIFRGKSLGTSFTDEQKARIADGSFKGFFIGDYWDIAGVRYRIADINYWIGSGQVPCSTNHLAIVPDHGVGGSKKMNNNDTTYGGYYGSNWHMEYYVDALTVIENAFSHESILIHQELLTTDVTNGIASAGAWNNSSIDLMNEPMVYGSYMIAPGSNGSVIAYLRTIDKTQLALFRLNPRFIISGVQSPYSRQSYWLRDPVSSQCFSVVGGGGNPEYGNASADISIRPVFGIFG